MQISKSRGIIFAIMCAVFCFAFLFCACGEKNNTKPKDDIPQNISEIVVKYDGETINEGNTFEVLEKMDGNIKITIDSNTLSLSSLDWTKLELQYKLEDSQEYNTVSEPQKYVSVTFVDDTTGVENKETEMPTTAKPGKYNIKVTYGKELNFVVTVRKESSVKNLTLSFKQNEFEVKKIKSSDWTVLSDTGTPTDYKFAYSSVEEYKSEV